MSRERLLDVSALEPCEPMERTLAALGSLAPGEYLRVLHRREPFLLYPMLAERGFDWRTREGTRTPFEIHIWRRDDADAAAAAARA